MTQENKIRAFEAIGGTRWQHDTMDRIYINDLARWSGLEVVTYGSGNIRSATLDGETISNTAARKLGSMLALGKLWYDLTDGRYHARGIDQGEFDIIVARVRAAVEQAESAAS